MKKYCKAIIIAFLNILPLIFNNPVHAQKSCIYEFKKTLEESSKQGPSLTPLGSAGVFVEESLPELGGIKRTVYKFDKNCGLNYNMRNSVLNLSGSYSIEIYFKFDELESWKRVIDFKNRGSDNGAYIFNGKLNFYNIATSTIAPVAPGAYTHYTFTYDASSKMVKIYADGIGKISFMDTQNDAVIDPRELHFFYDDLQVNNEASSGTVAYIKFFDYVVSPEEAEKNFKGLEKTVVGAPKTISPGFTKTKLQINVLNANSQSPVPCNIEISDKQSGMPVITIPSNGKSEMELPKGNYVLTVKANSFATTTEEVNIDLTSESINKEIKLTPIQIGEQVKLENVHFKQGEAVLLPESFPVLDKLVKMLKDNEGMEIELSGHTDNQGDPQLNLKLSEDRVILIKNYLISKGIHAKRVQGKGYGGSHPVASNAKEETRKLNRRVDFKVTKL
jgi:OOP family OmpA-OmpF porin